MTGDITYRLNVNSVTQVYSAFLPAFILYPKYPHEYIGKLNKFNYNFFMLAYRPYSSLGFKSILLSIQYNMANSANLL